MAVELNRLYDEIYAKYNVKLETTSCVNKTISWLHILENIEFAPFLHGDELVFNASLNGVSDDERKYYIDQMLRYNAGGLIVSLQKGREFSQALIDYCNEKQLPLFTTGWDTPFINLTRIFSEILIDKERADMDLIAALKNAIHYPSDTELYVPHFEDNHFNSSGNYIVSIIRYTKEDSVYFNESIKRIEKSIQNSLQKSITYREATTLVCLTYDCEEKHLTSVFSNLALRFSDFLFGIGSLEVNLMDVHRSYTNAQNTLVLCNSVIPKNPLCYGELGLYQLLSDLKNPHAICPPFVENTLGKLIEYDQKHRTKYMEVLTDFFENDCSITQTANATFYHQNTLKYKIKSIKEILGYDIMSNQHRVNIMLSLAILKIMKEKG